MKVKELIKRLKKLDQEAKVVWQSHDQFEDEVEGYVRFVKMASEQMIEKEKEDSIVVLSP